MLMLKGKNIKTPVESNSWNHLSSLCFGKEVAKPLCSLQISLAPGYQDRQDERIEAGLWCNGCVGG